MLAGVVGRHEVLATVLDPLDGLAQLYGGEGYEEVFWVELAGDAKPAALVALDEMDAVLGHVEQARQDIAVEVGHLGHAVHVELVPAGIVGGGQPTGLQRVGGVAVAAEGLFTGVFSILECLVRVSVNAGVVGGLVGAVVFMQKGVVGGGGRHVMHGRQRLVAHVDGVTGVLGYITAGGDDHRNGLAYVAHLVMGYGVLQEAFQPRKRGHAEGNVSQPDALGDVVGGEHRFHSRDLPCLGGVDGQDAGMGVGASEDGGVKEVLELEVVGVLAAAGQEAHVLLAGHGPANVCGHVSVHHRSG